MPGTILPSGKTAQLPVSPQNLPKEQKKGASNKLQNQKWAGVFRLPNSNGRSYKRSWDCQQCPILEFSFCRYRPTEKEKKGVLSSWLFGSSSVSDIYTTRHNYVESLASVSGCRPAHPGVERDTPLPRLVFVQLSRLLLGGTVQTLPVRVTPLASDAVAAELIYQWPGSLEWRESD